MTAKRAVLVAMLVAGALMVLAWSQSWFELVLTDDRHVGVPGSAAGPGVLATGLASLAIAAAMTIAPRVLRFVLGGLAVAVGLIAVIVAVGAVADPLGASLATVSTETGVAGRASIEALVVGLTTLPWPWVAIGGGVLAAVAGAGALVTARRWPVSGSRYERAPAEPEAWDVLTEGDDPTR